MMKKWDAMDPNIHRKIGQTKQRTEQSNEHIFV